MVDKRNPNLVRGDGETDESYLGRIDEFLSKLRWQSEGHRLWYTHKNPSGCWICELIQVGELLRDEIVAEPRDATDSSEGITSDDDEEQF